jgi:hypothetical protein
VSWTKKQFIEQAFAKIGMAGDIPNLTAEQKARALLDLDSMMATWNAIGVRIGYPLPSSQAASSLDQETHVPDSANEAIYLNHGIRIAPDFGKLISPEHKMNAKIAYNNLVSQTMGEPPQRQLPGSMPAGAGNRQRAPFLTPPVDPLLSGQDGEIEFD